jgi:ribosomal protein L5
LAETVQQAAPKAAGMRELKVAKVTVNIGVGQAGDRLEKAEKVLAGLTGRKPMRTTARGSHRDWQVREGQPIGVKVTLRGEAAVDFAKRALWTRNFRVADWSFDREGNLNFGSTTPRSACSAWTSPSPSNARASGSSTAGSGPAACPRTTASTAANRRPS